MSLPTNVLKSTVLKTDDLAQDLYQDILKHVSITPETTVGRAHLITPVNGVPNMTSSLHYKWSPTIWHLQTLSEIPGTVSENDDRTFIYRANTSYFGLEYIVLIQEFPAVEVNDDDARRGVQICRPRNSGSNILLDGSLSIDGVKINSLNSVYIDQNYQHHFNGKLGADQDHEEALGNSPDQTEWTTSLPKLTTRVILPFYYSKDPGTNLPLYFTSVGTKVEHKLTFRRQHSEMLRIRIRESGLTEQERTQLADDALVTENDDLPRGAVSFNNDALYRLVPKTLMKEYISDKLSVEDSTVYETDRLSPPQVFGMYLSTTKNTYLATIDSSNVVKNIWINDITTRKEASPEPDSTGSVSTRTGSISMDLGDIGSCSSLYWVAQSTESLKYNIHSNYTTHPYNSRLGKEPISHTALTYKDDLNKVEKPEASKTIFDLSTVLAKTVTSRHFQSIPRERGYQGWSFGNVGSGPQVKSSVLLNKSKLLVSLSDTKNKYIIHCNLTTNKILEVLDYPKSLEARATPNQSSFKFRLLQ